MNVEKLFVYGTLREKGSASHLMQNCIKLETNLIISGFCLYDAGEYPFAVFTGRNTDQIIGDLYAVSESDFYLLDDYEGDEYIKIKMTNLDFYIYILKEDKIPSLPVVTGGDWLAYKMNF